MAVKKNSNYTYDDFTKRLESSGTSFSDADLKLARQNPDAGMSLIGYKEDYARASTDDARAMANAKANSLRSAYGGYTGGEDGSRYFLDNPTPSSYQTEDFSYSRQGDLDGATDKMVNRQEWSYNPDTDPYWQAAKKQYLREGNRAMQDTMGNYAGMTGGMPSTAAISAANQASNYYNSQLTDKLGEYMNQDYQRYIDSVGLDFDTLSALKSLRDTERADYDADRNYGYSQWTDNLAYRDEREQADYDRKWNEDARTYERDKYEREYRDDQLRSLYDLYMERYQLTGESKWMKMANEMLSQIDTIGAYQNMTEQEAALAAATASGGGSSGGSGKSSGGSGSSSKDSSGSSGTSDGNSKRTAFELGVKAGVDQNKAASGRGLTDFEKEVRAGMKQNEAARKKK